MPVYDMECPSGHSFEALIGMTSDSTETCPECGQPAKRLISASTLLLRCTNLHTMDPAERTMGLQNKADIERDMRSAIAAGRDPAEVVQYRVPPSGSGCPPEFIPKV